MIEEAHAERIERINRAQGEAGRFLALMKEYHKSRAVTETRLYVETMEEILPRLKKYLLDKEQGAGVVDLRMITPGQK